MTIGSLFSGIGGLELGLEWAGLGPVRWQVEREPERRALLARWWPDAARFDDVRTVGVGNLEPVEVICGGFPCPDISYAGSGAGLDGERSGLFYELLRVVREMGPRIVVVENVSALLTRGLGEVLGRMASLGYDAEWHSFRASDVGAPHRRDRTFIIGCKRSLAYANEGGPNRLSTDDVQTYAGVEKQRWYNVDGRGTTGRSRPDFDDKGSATGWRGAPKSVVGGVANGFPGRVARWPARPGEAAHAWEAPRIMTSATAKDAAALAALGDAVVPEMSYHIGLRARVILGAVRLVECMEGESEP